MAPGIRKLLPTDIEENPKTVSAVRFWRYVQIVCVFLAICALAYEATFVATWATDIPRSDEWYLFTPDIPHFEVPPSFEYLHSSNGSHRILMSRLLYSLMYSIDGMNFAHIKLVNYVLFSVAVFLLLGLKDQTIGADRFPLFPLFVVFLFSPIDAENHTWAYQSQVHFAVLFAILASYFGFRNGRGIRDDVVFVSSCLAGMFSFACGVGMSSVFVAAYLLRAVLLYRARAEKYILLRAAVVAAIIIGAIRFWLTDRPQSHASAAMFVDSVFWKFLLNLISLGYGFESSLSLIPGVIVCVLLGAATLSLLKTGRDSADSATWTWVAFAWSVFVGLIVISLGRSGDYNGAYVNAKTSRYSEIAFQLVPAVAMLLYLALRSAPKIRRAVLPAYFGFVFAGYYSNWDYSSFHFSEESQTKASRIIESYFAGSAPEAIFPFVAPRSLKPELDYATKMHIHFAEQQAIQYHRDDLLYPASPQKD